MHGKNIILKIIKTIVLPVAVYGIFASISLATGNPFLTTDMMAYLLKIVCTTAIISMAISLHLINGGFDFSAGAIMFLGAIVGGNFALNNDLGPWGMLLFITIITTVLGLINGMLYIVLRLPPLVVSLATVMIYEAFTQIVNKGNGIKIVTKPQYAVLSKQPTIYFIFLFVAVIFWALLKYTKFGFRARALATGQKVAVNSGIKEKQNVLMRYGIFGILLGIAATLHLSNILTISAAMNMSSTLVMFDGIMPVVVGLTLAAFSNIPIGIFMAVFTMKIINIGFVCMGANGTLSSIISGVFLLVFVVITENANKIKTIIHNKKRNQELAGILGNK